LWSISSTFYEQLLRKNFCAQKLHSQNVTREKLLKRLSYKRGAHKTLVKLTLCYDISLSEHACYLVLSITLLKQWFIYLLMWRFDKLIQKNYIFFLSSDETPISISNISIFFLRRRVYRHTWQNCWNGGLS
jgi:hypothetical protein